MHFNSKFILIEYNKVGMCSYFKIIFKIFIKEIFFTFNKLENSYSICIGVR